MLFEDTAFFGMARTGSIEGKIRYPGLMNKDDVMSLRMDAGTNAYSINQFRINWMETDDLVIIPDAIIKIQRPGLLLRTLEEIFRKVGYRKLIYAQGIGDPYLIPSLVYCGISLFDDLYISSQSSEGVIFGALGKRKGVERDPFDDNLKFTEEILQMTSEGIKNRTLREMVEKFTISSKAVEILRLLDNRYHAQSEIGYPVRTPYLKANSTESLSRPDLERFRKYVSEQYRRPEAKNTALIIPCSAKKPYSSSRSHQSLIQSLGRMRDGIHEIIVTSPVGVVPRDLEETYPARFYDIPVTGKWSEDEKMMLKNTLSSFFSNNTYDHVFCLIKEELDFIEESLPESHTVIHGRIDNQEDQAKLKSEIARKTVLNHSRCDCRRESMLQMASYQFGNWIVKEIADSRILRNYNQYMFTNGGKVQLVFNQEKGMFSINKSFAATFVKNNRFVVSIDDFKPTSEVYAVGVTGATEDVRIEGEIVMSHEGEARGTGTAKMTPQAMVELNKGVAVKVR